ncbi:LOW QUALITY PROTEIN: threonine aspartase 1-like [Liolophura sinensis]|uniref:LOW QUALITY PROTEIN: threonine aspartase 1-like n=1 Tax=Liolophura sinensis TaxID=3198878 RepID=UPI00315823DA
MANKAVIMVHAGAGYHSVSREKQYKEVCEEACKQAMTLLLDGASALDGVAAAVKVLEDSSCTNAGLGSALTLEGKVECDSGVMDGESLLFGAVGAISGVKNPVCVAKKLVEGQTKTLSLGRIPPSVLVGTGASDWALHNGCEVVTDSTLITDFSLKTYCQHKRKLEETENKKAKRVRGHLKVNNEEKTISDDDPSLVQDTVGAVCLDSRGNVASAVSSGGISLKHPGRIGQAAVYGAGCWAESKTPLSPGVAVSTSGCGEHLMRTLLARECAQALHSTDIVPVALSQTFVNKFLGSKFLQNVSEKLGGVIVMKHQTEGEGDEDEKLGGVIAMKQQPEEEDDDDDLVDEKLGGVTVMTHHTEEEGDEGRGHTDDTPVWCFLLCNGG